MTTQEIVTKLQAASNAYYNSSEVCMSDAEFDKLHDKLKEMDPENPFLK